jgi:hypothetical protein
MSKKDVVIPYDPIILERMQKQIEARRLTPEQRKAKAECLKELDQIDRQLGIIPDGHILKRKQSTVSLTPEEQTILEALACENPMTVTQESLATVTGLTDRTVRKHLKYLKTKRLVDQPRGPKKGFSITANGLSLIGQ